MTKRTGFWESRYARFRGGQRRRHTRATDMDSPRLSRRAALRLVVSGAAVSVLAACGVSAPTTTQPTLAPTSAPVAATASKPTIVVGAPTAAPAGAPAGQPKTGGTLRVG